MSLVRFALRQAALAAVCPPLGPADPLPSSHPTLAERRWHDSMMSSVRDLAADQRRPLGVVGTTDSVTAEKAKDDGLHGGGFAMTTLVFHLAIASLTLEAGEWVPARPVTDAELDASLDLFEHQVVAAVLRSPLVALCSPFGVHQVRSIVDREAESGVRLAGRRVEMDVSIYDDLDPAEWGETPRVLEALAAAMPAGSRQRTLLDTMAASAATPVSSFEETALAIGLALDLGLHGDAEAETEHLRAAVTTTAGEAPADPRTTADPTEPEPEGPIDETDPRNLTPFTPPRT